MYTFIKTGQSQRYNNYVIRFLHAKGNSLTKIHSENVSDYGKVGWLVGWLVGFLTSSSTTRFPRQSV